MPQMNGFELIKEMKAHGVQSKVVVSSGYADKNAAVTAPEFGRERLFGEAFHDQAV